MEDREYDWLRSWDLLELAEGPLKKNTLPLRKGAMNHQIKTFANGLPEPMPKVHIISSSLFL